MVTAIEHGVDFRGEDEGLRAARAGAVADVLFGQRRGALVVGVRGQHECNPVAAKLVGDGDLPRQARQGDDPLAVEDRLGAGLGGLGRPIEDALEDSAQRMTSVDLMWAVMAIRIQREVGGNLAELLDTVADTMTQRERLRLEIKALTAEGRFSGWILGLFPVVFAGVLYLIQPDYMGVLFQETMGIMAMIACGVMTFIGFIWLRKILQIEV